MLNRILPTGSVVPVISSTPRLRSTAPETIFYFDRRQLNISGLAKFGGRLKLNDPGVCAGKCCAKVGRAEGRGVDHNSDRNILWERKHRLGGGK
eukprot:3148582-Rhodomonas_salina.2